MVTTDVFIVDTDGIRWPARCDCGAHPDRGHEAQALPGDRRRGGRDRERSVVDAIAALAKARAVVELDAQHRLVVLARRPLDEETAELVRHHRLLLAWAVRGRDTGHEWLACDVCGEAQLAAPGKVARCCHMTPGCAGRIQRPPARLLDPKVAEGWRHLTTSPTRTQGAHRP